MAGSRYKKKFCKWIDEYLADNQDIEKEFHKTVGDKSNTYEQKVIVNLPSIEGFVAWMRDKKNFKIIRLTVYNWMDKYPEFKSEIEKIKDEQFKRLINNGLSGRYNHVITKLMLSHNHGMKERTDITTDDKPINTFSDEQADRIAERLARRKESDGNPSS